MSSLPRPSLSSLNSALSRQDLRAFSLESAAWSRTFRAWPRSSWRAAISVRSWSRSGGGSELVRELVSLGVVEVVFVLLPVGQAALQLGEPAGPLGRRQVFEILEQGLLLFQPAANRLVDGHRRTGEASLEDRPRQGNARLPSAARLRQELVDVGGNGLVEVVLLNVQLESDRVRVPVGEKPPATQVAEVFLEPAECPRAIGAEFEDVAADLGCLASHPVRLGEQVRSR